MRSILIGAAIAAIGCSAAEAQTKPNHRELLKIADALGGLAADFDTCGGRARGKMIRDRFEIAIAECTDDEAAVMRRFDRSKQNRAGATDNGSYFCRNDADQRYTFVRNKITEVNDACSE